MRSKALILILFSLFLTLSASTVSAQCVSTKIMPLGDSITHGTGEVLDNPYVVGYRQFLWQKLVNAGYPVDLVGSLSSGSLALPAFDTNHEGHGGWTAADIADHVYGWLENTPPEVVLLHVGTNNLDSSDMAASLTNAQRILTEIDRYELDYGRSVKVILAQIVNRQTHHELTSIYNANLYALAASRKAAGDLIWLVDMEHALSYPGDMADLLHPSSSGYSKMADVWFSAIGELLLACTGAGNQAPNGVIDLPAGNLTIKTGQSISFTATGSDPDGNLPLQYSWQFGGAGALDSNLEDPGPVQFNTPGSYTVSLTVRDSLGLADPTPATRVITVVANSGVIPQWGWALRFVDSQQLTTYAAANAFDGNVTTMWHTQFSPSNTPYPHEIQINLGQMYDIDGFRYLPRQDGGVNGRIAQYEFYVSEDGITWGSAVVAGAFANSATEKEFSFTPKTGQFIRLKAVSEVNGNPWAAMAEINVMGLLSGGNRAPNGTINSPAGDMTIVVGQSVSFAGTGSDPDVNLPLQYQWQFGGSGAPNSNLEDPGFVQFNTPGTYTVSLTVTDALGLADPSPATRVITVTSNSTVIPRTGWSLKSVDSQQLPTYAATYAFDGNTATMWHTQYSPSSTPYPHDIQINLGQIFDIDGFRYLPRQDGGVNGRIAQYEFYVSQDGATWGTAVATGTFANSAAEKEVSFTKKAGQFIRLRALSEVGGNPWAAMAEINVLGFLSGANRAPDGAIDSPSGDVAILVGQTVSFAGAGSDPDGNLPLQYLWQFGGSGALDSNLEDPGAIQFNAPGTYTVSLTVSDALGLADPTPATRVITVTSNSTVIPRTGWSLKSVDSQQLPTYAATYAFDGNVNTFWHTQFSPSSTPYPHEIQINLGQLFDLDGFRYLPRQDGGVNGRIAQYEFYVSADGITWGSAVATGTFVNSATEKEVSFAKKTGQFIRLIALSEATGKPWAAMAEISVLGVVSQISRPPDSVIDSPSGNVTIVAGQSVSFAGTGSDPDGSLPLQYLWQFGGSGEPNSILEDPGFVQFDTPGTYTVSFTVTDAEGQADLTPATRVITVTSDSPAIPRAGWTLRYVDSQNTDGENGADGLAVYAYDGNVNTMWHTQYYPVNSYHPHEIQISLGQQYEIDGFRYLPRQDGSENGRIAQYEFYVSEDGNTWGTPVATGTFVNSAAEQSVSFAPKTGRFIRIRALSEVNARPWATIAELNVMGRVPGTNRAPQSTIDSPSGDVKIIAGQSVSFTGTGSDPDGSVSLEYLWQFGGSGAPNSNLEDPGPVLFNTRGTYTVSLTVSDNLGLADPTPAARVIQVWSNSPVISRTAWTLKYVDSENLVGENGADGLAIHSFDGNVNSIWHTEYNPLNPAYPHEIQINLGRPYAIDGFRYLPRQDGSLNGRIAQYKFYVSEDGITWGTAVATGTFDDSSLEQEIAFTPKTGQFIRLEALSAFNGQLWATMAEINVLGNEVNVMPNIVSTPATSILRGATYIYDVDATGFPAPTYSATGLPVGAINPSSGRIEWIANPAGSYPVTVLATNTLGTDDQTFTIEVMDPPATCPADMTHYWRLDETSAPYADSYRGTAATCAPADCPSAATGKLNGGQRFTEYTKVSVADGNTFDWSASSSFSIESWIKTEPGSTCAGNQVVIGRDDGALGNLHWWLGCSDAGVATFTLVGKVGGVGDQAGIIGTKTIADASWHHIVVVRDAVLGEIRIYVDGVKENSLPASFTSGFDAANVPMTLGWLNLGAGFHFTGDIDEVALYNRALLDGEVQQHYEMSGYGYCDAKVAVTAKANGNGAGNVQSSVGGIVYHYPTVMTQTTSVLDRYTPITLTATADTGSTVLWNDCAAAGGSPSGNGSTTATCVFSSLDVVKTITATFTLNQYTVTATAGANGSLSGTTTSPATVNHGSSAHFTFNANAGYHVLSVSDTCGGTPHDNTSNSESTYAYASGLITSGGCAVSATFAINAYALAYSAGANGTINGATPQTKTWGGNGDPVTAVPSLGYHFVQWSDSSTTNPRTDTNVTANIAVTASFAINSYTLTYTAGANGTITGAASQSVNHGENGTTVTAVPATGYHFVQWNNGSTDNPRTDTNVTGDVTLTANFAINTYTLTYSAGANGTIDGLPSVAQTVNHAANGTPVTAIPAPTFGFEKWSDGSTANPRTDTNVTGNITVTASFVVPAAPRFLSTANTKAVVGQIYTYSVEASGSPDPTISLDPAAPSGMQIEPGSGPGTANLTWTPTAPVKYEYPITLTAANGVIPDATQPYLLRMFDFPSNMSHYWKFDENSGVTTFDDSYGSNDATCSTNCPTQATGKVNGAQQFDASSMVIASDDGTLDWSIGQSFSIEFWMKTDAGSTCGTDHVIVGRDDSVSWLNWWVGCKSSTGKAAFYLYDKNNVSASVLGTTALNDAGWHHVVAVRDATQSRLYMYVDGALQNSFVTPAFTGGFDSTAPLNIGYLAGGHHFRGMIDEVAIYDKALSEGEVSRHYYHGSNGYGYSDAVSKVTSQAGSNGSISPSGNQSVKNGDTTAFTVTPATGFHAAVTGCGGTLVGATYTTDPVMGDCTVSASFSSNQYLVSAAAGANGNVTEPSAVTANHGSTVQFNFNAGTGYHVSAISGCGLNYVNTANTVSSYLATTAPITGICTVNATFALNRYPVTATAGANGTLDFPSSPQTVDHGSTIEFGFLANPGYHVAGVTDGCGGPGYANTSNDIDSYTYRTGIVTANCGVTATFAINRYQVTATAGAGGSLNAGTSTPQTVNHGNPAQFRFDATTGFRVASITDNCSGPGYVNSDPLITSYTYATAGITTTGCAVSATFAGNAAPVITSQALTWIPSGQIYGYDVNAAGSPAPTYSLVEKPAGMTIDGGTGIITWLAPDPTNYDYPVTVQAANGVNPAGTQSFRIQVLKYPAAMNHYWRLDESTGATLFQDYKGTGNAYCSGSNCPTATAGKANGAQQFIDGGTPSMVNVPAGGSFEWGVLDSFSIEAWIKTSPGNGCLGDQAVIGRNDSSTGLYWFLGCQDDGELPVFYLRDRDGKEATVGGSSSLADGNWHHLVAVRDAAASRLRLYVDSVAQPDSPGIYTGGFSSTVEPLNIGWLNDSTGGHHFEGVIDELALYNGVLSEIEIQRNHSHGINSFGPADAVSIVTASVSGNHGTISPAGPQAVQTYQSTLQFTVTPENASYHPTVTGCGGTLTGTIYTTAQVTADCAVSATFTAGLTPTITWDNPASITYGTALGGTQLNASAGGVPGTFIYTPAAGAILNAGTGQTLRVDFTPDDPITYNPTSKTVAIDVNKASATVTLDNLTQGYTGSALTPTATTAPAGLTIAWTGAPQTNAGSYPVIATINNPNYAGSAGDTFVINKAVATVTLGNLTQAYTGSALTPTATTSPAGLMIAWTGTPQTNAGSYPVIATINNPNYAGSSSDTFVINKAVATVTLGSLTQAYTGSALTPTATTAPTGLTIAWTGTPQTNAGSYPVIATINNPNYAGSSSDTFVINKAVATVTLGNLTQIYTGSALTPTATTAPAGLTIDWTGTPQTNAGSYPVIATINSPNYAGSASDTFVINKAVATVTLDNLTQGYTGSALTPTATTAPAGLTIDWTGTPQTNAGSYPVTATINNPNYAGSASDTFVINKAVATVTLGNLTQAYTGSALTPTATTAPAGLTIAWTGAPQTNAGSYPVIATINSPNYAGSASDTFVINKAAAPVTLGNLTQAYTGSALTPTATTVPAGLTIDWTGAPQTNVGSFPVTATINNPNYAGSAGGTFVINKAAAPVTLGNLTQIYTGSALTPTATTVPAGLTIDWTGTPQTNAGSYPVTATINNPNYAGTASGTLVINKAPAAVILSNLNQNYDGSPKTATVTTTPTGLAIAVTYDGFPTAPTTVGSYLVLAIITDPNYTGSTSGTLVIADGAAPVVTISNGPVSPTKVTDAAFVFSATDDLTPPANIILECSLDSAVFASCVSPKSYTGLAEGSHVFAVKATDDVGNVSEIKTWSWAIDQTAPLLTMTSMPFDPSNTANPLFKFTSSETSAFTCQIDGQAPEACQLDPNDPLDPAKGAKQYIGLLAGYHSFVLSAIDGAGNTWSISFEWEIDLSVPGMTIDSSPLSLSNSSEAPFTFHSGESSTFTCQLEKNGVPYDISACVLDPDYPDTRGSKDYSGLGDGTYKFTVTATDWAGNMSTRSWEWEIDLIPPVVTIESILPNPTSGGTTVTWSAVENGTFKVRVRGTEVAAGNYTAPAQVNTVISGASFIEGNNLIEVCVTDQVGFIGCDTDNLVKDTAAPVLSLQADITAEATSGSGAAVTFTATANDAVDGSVAVTCAPASGSTFPLGETTVNCSATDSLGHTANGSFKVTVADSTAPTITGLADITAEATSASGAVVNYTAATANDVVDGPVEVTCTQISGSTFPLGETTVECSASDSLGHTAKGNFTVTVADNTAPTITGLADITAEATSASGAVVNYAAATVTDAVDPAPLITYSKASGTTFPLGLTTVTVTATDATGNSSADSFTVTVADTTAPALSLPGDITAEATSASGAAVNYTAATATDAVDPAPLITYSKASGTTFPLGLTTVTVTATDATGNSSADSFTVTVADTTAPVLSLPGDITAEATSASGAVVNYAAATATDAVDPAPIITYSKASGTTFPLGLTTVTVTATDATGNSSADSFTVTVADTTAPVLSLPSDITAEATSASGAVVNYAAATATDAVDPTPLITYSKASRTTFPFGPTTVTVTATDATGNSSADSFTVTVQDTTPPSSLITFPEDGLWYNQSLWNSGCGGGGGDVCGNANDSGAGLQEVLIGIQQVSSGLYWSGSAFDSASEFLFSATGIGSWVSTFGIGSFPADGDYIIHSKARDLEGNIEAGQAVTFTIDRTGPVITLVTPEHGSSTNDSTPTFSGVGGLAEADLPTITVNIYNSENLTLAVQTLYATRDGSTGNYSVDASSSLTDATYVALAEQEDGVENIGFSSANTFIVDTTAPTASIVFPANGSSYSQNGWNDGCSTSGVGDLCGTAIQTGAAAIQKVELSICKTGGLCWNSSTGFFDNASPIFHQANGTDSWTYDFAFSQFADGSYTVHVKATDILGNVETGTTRTFVIDGMAPQTTIISPTPQNPTTSKRATFNFSSSETGSTFECRLDSGSWSPCTSPKQYGYSPDPSLTVGGHTFEVRAIDTASNVDPTQAIFTWTINP